jgi:potassium-dependent mechanosensitive channel
MTRSAALFALLWVLTGAAWAQDGGSISAQPAAEETPVEVEEPETSGPDYAAWARAAQRTEVIAESGRGSAFALQRLRAELVVWRDRFLAEQATNAARIGTVEAQITALGAAIDGATEDPRVTTRRTALQTQLNRLQAPILLAEEAYAHANGLVGEIDRLIRARQTNELLTRGTSPLNPANWPGVLSGLSARTTGLWKELTTSVRSSARWETFRGTWPGAMLFIGLGLILMTRGRAWMQRMDGELAASAGRADFSRWSPDCRRQVCSACGPPSSFSPCRWPV